MITMIFRNDVVSFIMLSANYIKCWVNDKQMSLCIFFLYDCLDYINKTINYFLSIKKKEKISINLYIKKIMSVISAFCPCKSSILNNNTTMKFVTNVQYSVDKND